MPSLFRLGAAVAFTMIAVRAALKPHVGEPGDGFALKLFAAGTSAVCLDGSPCVDACTRRAPAAHVVSTTFRRTTHPLAIA